MIEKDKIEEFAKFVQDELSWNGAKVKHLPEWKEPDGTPVQVFEYECLEGSSVKKEIREALKKFGLKRNAVKVEAGDYNFRGAVFHEYYIKIIK